jgi:hypothetical protein
MHALAQQCFFQCVSHAVRLLQLAANHTCHVCVISCVGGGLFICFTRLHVPHSTVDYMPYYAFSKQHWLLLARAAGPSVVEVTSSSSTRDSSINDAGV